MPGMSEHRLGGAKLHQLAPVHDPHPVAQVLHHGQVMGDEQDGEPVLLPQMGKQVDDLGLNGHVQRRHRLVRHQQPRLHGESAGDGHTLALAAGQLRRILVQIALLHAHVVQLKGGFCPQTAPGRLHMVNGHGLGDDLRRRHPGIQAGGGVLKDQLALRLQPAAVGAVLCGIAGVDAVIIDMPRRGAVHVHDAAGHGGFAAAALPHQSQYLALLQLEGHVVHRPKCLPARQGKAVGQVLHVQQDIRHSALLLPARAPAGALWDPAATWPRSGYR